MKNVSSLQVIIPSNINPLPERHEVSAAQIMASFFRSDVEFVVRDTYKSPDLKIGDDFWEIKSPTGMGKRNIERQLQLAMKQSSNIILDARRSKIHISKVRSQLSYQAALTKGLRRLVLITKTGKVEVIK
ncbi:hypothetical protein KDA14_02070 [Candidatus Saccharibacteria bacterium]|nr:hypothetical protein [Candidatus Saccharibacteria bacterium]